MEQSTRRSVLRGVGAATTSGVGIAAASERGAAETFDEFGVYVYVAWLEEGDWLPGLADHAREVARKKPVHTVYPMMPTTEMPSEAKEKWFDFVEDVHGYGVDVVPTVGGGGGGVDADEAKNQANQIMNWDEDAPYDSQIDGLQVDVETGNMSELADFHDWFQWSFDLSEIRYSVAVQGRWHTEPEWERVVEHDAVDHVNLMAYGPNNGSTVRSVIKVCKMLEGISTDWELLLSLNKIHGSVEYATGTFADKVVDVLEYYWWRWSNNIPVRVSVWHAEDIDI